MSDELIAGVLWTILGVSILLALVAAAQRSWPMMLIAGMLAFVFAIPALPSIGLFILVIAVAEIVVALVMRRREDESTTP
ncbi:hypothetical protein [Sphaerobacter sp.]|uniref:hypothetical protein n=1 Tax=Sphaerobacter sp. TaxID=2099654 RepID=UPI001DC157B9|nr:hypothetical protein [Sphaerobacter sp.]MBX5443979.1 hypothetical protein [Sphaerobacter sp.]